MRVQIDTYNVYKFEELTEEVREVVLERFRQNEQFEFLGDDMEYKLEELLKKYKLKYDDMPRVYFSLSYCQGDGAMFEGTVYWKSYTVDIKHSGRYYHYNSKNIDMYSTKTDKDASEEVYHEFNELYVDLCHELEKYGYAVMDDILSDGSIIDSIDANELEFTADGRVV